MATESAKLNGKVINGVVVFENGESLPEGTDVMIQPVYETSDAEVPEDIQSLRTMLLSLAGTIKDDDLPADLSDNLDHYLYGTPKKGE